MEKIIVKHLHNYVLEHHIITEHQSGFQPKDSTVNQLVYIYITIISNLDIGKDIRFICAQGLRVSVSKYMEVVHIAMTD
jgi:hypothetical protein